MPKWLLLAMYGLSAPAEGDGGDGGGAGGGNPPPAKDEKPQADEKPPAPKDEKPPAPPADEKPPAPPKDEPAPPPPKDEKPDAVDRAEFEALKQQHEERFQRQNKAMIEAELKRVGLPEQYHEYAPWDADMSTDDGRSKMQAFIDKHPEWRTQASVVQPPNNLADRVKDKPGSKFVNLQAWQQSRAMLKKGAS